MAGYLDTYGVAEQKRSGFIKKIVLAVLTIAIVGGAGYFYFRTWSQERAVKGFLESLSKQDYAAAYRLWGCTPEAPCKFYNMEKFNEDWGPKSAHAKTSEAKVENVEYCDSKGVVFNLAFPNQPPVTLYVDRDTNVLDFAPWPQCPGRHFQFKQFFKNLFSS